MRRLSALLIILISVSMALSAVTAGTIYFATDDELRNMAELRGLPSDGTREALQNALYQYEGLEAYTEEIDRYPPG